MKKMILQMMTAIGTLSAWGTMTALAATNPLTGDESNVPLVAGIGAGALVLIILVLVLTGKKGGKKKR